MSGTVASESAQVASMDIEVQAGSGGDQCCACCRTPNCKNRWALLLEILGILGLAFNLAMLAEVDDILKCPFTTWIYFIGIGISGLFFILTATRLCGYEGFFNAHPVWRASCLLYTYCTDDCDGMTEYRKDAFKDLHVLAYIFLNVLIPGELIPLAASYIDDINGYTKAVGLKIEHPAALRLAIIGRPLVAIAQVILAGYNVYAQDGCSKLFKGLLVLGIVYVVVLGILYGIAFGPVFDDGCPRFFKNETATTMMMDETSEF
ncbi:PREDICTED: uncharacterized protein LOC109475438 [Branchiostoma belcheri]|uniref:Uncharacterized protein LOC109475438 n=1 Tax=Branchiostoma belcheri TaxID=7741 RepID=A0A6P4Z4T7_BRABE|nr:PREDICTED: uncharacterized protein LOC109475438 [Branchiostoma belcheri]